MNKFNGMTEFERRGLTPPQAPELPNSVADAYNVARAGERTPRSEQMADAQMQHQRAMDLARLDPASRERVARIQGDTNLKTGVMDLYGKLSGYATTANTEKARIGAVTGEAAATRQDAQNKVSPFIMPEPLVTDSTDPDVVADVVKRNQAAQDAAYAGMKTYQDWRAKQILAGQSPDWATFYQAYPDLALRYAPPEHKNQLGASRPYAEGGPVDAAPPPDPEQALVGAYQDYAAQAQQMNLPVVPFEVFSEMQGGAMQSVQGYAQGGSVAGKLVVDTDPNAPTDSIPAVVDESQPAKLNSGEFVFPTDVAAFFGTQRLNKMIEQARSGQEPTGAMAEARQ
jgi:hypothetical protein